MSTVKTLPFDGAFSISSKGELTMNKFDMNQMRKQVEAMHRLKAEAQAVEHIGESFDALEAEIGEVAELLEELGDALITVS